MASVVMERIRRRTEEILMETQAGFRIKRIVVDQLFTLRRLAEKYAELGKYFDSVCRSGEQ